MKWSSPNLDAICDQVPWYAKEEEVIEDRLALLQRLMGFANKALGSLAAAAMEEDMGAAVPGAVGSGVAAEMAAEMLVAAALHDVERHWAATRVQASARGMRSRTTAAAAEKKAAERVPDEKATVERAATGKAAAEREAALLAEMARLKARLALSTTPSSEVAISPSPELVAAQQVSRNLAATCVVSSLASGVGAWSAEEGQEDEEALSPGHMDTIGAPRVRLVLVPAHESADEEEEAPTASASFEAPAETYVPGSFGGGTTTAAAAEAESMLEAAMLVNAAIEAAAATVVATAMQAVRTAEVEDVRAAEVRAPSQVRDAAAPLAAAALPEQPAAATRTATVRRRELVSSDTSDAPQPQTSLPMLTRPEPQTPRRLPPRDQSAHSSSVGGQGVDWRDRLRCGLNIASV